MMKDDKYSVISERYIYWYTYLVRSGLLKARNNSGHERNAAGPGRHGQSIGRRRVGEGEKEIDRVPAEDITNVLEPEVGRHPRGRVPHARHELDACWQRSLEPVDHLVKENVFVVGISNEKNIYIRESCSYTLMYM